MKKLVCLALSLLVSATCVSGVFAEEFQKPVPISEELGNTSPILIAEVDRTPAFIETTGVVSKIYEESDGKKVIRIKDADGNETDFVVSADTALLDQEGILKEFKEGDRVTAYYKQPEAMTMIYPAKYYNTTALVKLGENDENVVTVNYFDENGLSKNQLLVIHLSDDAEVITPDGKAYTGDVLGKYLAVYSKAWTRSLPPQTTPYKIVVLNVIPEIKTVTVKNQEVIAGVKREKSFMLVELRPIAEALGYNVSWDDKIKAVMLNNVTSLSIGKDSYAFGRTAPVSVGEAPQLIEGKTYVPVEFFSKVLSYTAKYYDGNGTLQIENI